MISFYTLLVFLFGTFAIDVFLITALWAQMIATSIALLLIVFIDLFFKGNIKDSSAKLYFIILLIICVLSHPVSIGMVVIFFLAKLINSGILSKNNLFIILILGMLIAGAVLYFGTSLTGKYRNEVDLKYMSENYMSIFLLVFALYFMYINTHNTDFRSLIMTNLFITIISPGFVLWRPILSLLPIYSMFTAAGLYELLKSAISANKLMTYLIICSLIGMTIIYKIEVTNSFMQALLWEMETPPGIDSDLPRHIDPKAIRELYFGQKFTYNTTIEKYN